MIERKILLPERCFGTTLPKHFDKLSDKAFSVWKNGISCQPSKADIEQLHIALVVEDTLRRYNI